MNTNDLYQVALAERNGSSDRGKRPYGVARHTLINGDVVICFVSVVAGRSVTRSHYRTVWSLKLSTAQYAKSISQKKAAELLREKGE